MKKLNHILSACTIASILLLSACAKENNKYDKILTDGTWNVSSLTESSNEVVFDDYSDATPDETQITNNLSKLENGILTNTTETTDKIVGSADATELTENKYEYLSTMAFSPDGVYNSSTSIKLNHTKHAINGIVDFDNSVTVEPSTYASTNSWHWSNTGNSKTQISFISAIFDITLEKDKVTLIQTRTLNDTEAISTTQIRTRTQTSVLTMVLTK